MTDLAQEFPNQVTGHAVEGEPNPLEILADARHPTYGNASHYYQVLLPEMNGYQGIRFQTGPIKENGINGVTNEALIAIVMDRLCGFQGGPFNSPDNGEALVHLERAMECLHRRTKARIARGVEGTNVR